MSLPQAASGRRYAPAARYSVKTVRNALVPMRDGVRLAADITRPDADGSFPAIMGYSPYHKPTAAAYASARQHFAERGYVAVEFDLRGTGDSEGASLDMYAPEEIQDGHDMIEWIAAQPWCDGNVGMCGISYGGVVCWQVAMQAPPHLKAIIVRSGTDDAYTDWTYPGGSPRPFCFEQYAPQMTAQNFAPPNPELCGERWAEIWEQHLQNNVPWGLGFIKHQLDGPYWRSRSIRPDYGRVKCPVFVIGGWADWYPTPLLRAFENLTVPKRALIGPWGHYWPESGLPGPRIDGRRECLKWFDQWLKGEDTGVLDEPPVTVFVRKHIEPSATRVMDNGFWRAEAEWPPARNEDRPLYLHSTGALSPKPEATPAPNCGTLKYDPAVGMASGRHARPPLPMDQRPDEAYSLTYMTVPLEQDLELIGRPRAILHVSSTTNVTAFSVKLCDVAPDGTSALVTKGYLNATHRSSHSEPSPLEPGKVYELDVELLALAYVFEAGHRIRVAIASSDFPDAWPTPKPCTNTVYYGSELPSQIILPATPAQSPKLPEPDLRPSEVPLPAPEAVLKPDVTVTRDLIDGTATINQMLAEGCTSSFTVSSKEPAKAIAKATYRRAAAHPGGKVAVETQCITASDSAAFHHLVDVAIEVNDKLHFQKSWSESVPRELN